MDALTLVLVILGTLSFLMALYSAAVANRIEGMRLRSKDNEEEVAALKLRVERMRSAHEKRMRTLEEGSGDHMNDLVYRMLERNLEMPQQTQEYIDEE